MPGVSVVTVTKSGHDLKPPLLYVTDPADIPPPPTVVPDATNTGPRQSTIHEFVGGKSIRSTSDLPAWTTGSGTLLDPFVISRTLFSGVSWVGGFVEDPSDWDQHYIVYEDCVVYGQPANPTDGTPNGIAAGVRPDWGVVPLRTTYRYCRVGPNTTPVPNGGPPTSVGGFDKSFFFKSPFTVEFCDIWGAAVNIQFVNAGPSDPYNYIRNNYIHDQWVSPGDHSDAINGADPTNASNIVIENNTINGACAQRTNNRVVYCIAAYNTNPIDNWQIRKNVFSNADVGIFDSVGAGQPITNIVIEDNVFDMGNIEQTHQGVVTSQHGNKTLLGDPITV